MSDALLQALFTLLCTLIGALFTIQVFRGGKRSETAREQLDAVYSEAFRLVEPFLYKTISRKECDAIVAKLEGLSKTGAFLCSPDLMLAIAAYNKSPNGDLSDYKPYKYSLIEPTTCYLTNWYRLCLHIDRYYDLLRRRSFLPVRSIGYRLQYSQYINGFIWVINLVRFDWPVIVILLILLMSLFQSVLT